MEFEDLISTAEVAEKTGKSVRWIQAMAGELVRLKLGKRIGKVLVCHKNAVKHINNRPEKRGRKKKSVV